MIRGCLLVACLLLTSGSCFAAPTQPRLRPTLRPVAAPSVEEAAPTAATLQRLRQPLQRSAALQALSRNPAIAAALQGKLSPGRNLLSLRTQTVEGTSVAAATMPAMRATQTTGTPPPDSLEGLDWARGVLRLAHGGRACLPRSDTQLRSRCDESFGHKYLAELRFHRDHARWCQSAQGRSLHRAFGQSPGSQRYLPDQLSNVVQ